MMRLWHESKANSKRIWYILDKFRSYRADVAQKIFLEEQKRERCNSFNFLCDFLQLRLRNTDFDFTFYFFHFDLRFWTQIYKENKINVSGLADLSPLFLKSPLIANPLTAMASKKVR
jgi:hypothetical protein